MEGEIEKETLLSGSIGRWNVTLDGRPLATGRHGCNAFLNETLNCVVCNGEQ